MKKTILGLTLIAAVPAVAVAATMIGWGNVLQTLPGGREPVNVTILYAEEKKALLKNPAIREIIEGRYRITLKAIEADSTEMATSLDTTGKDCIWSSTLAAVELAGSSGQSARDQAIYGSPLVFYTWAEVADALFVQGAVTKDGAQYVADVAAILNMVAEGKQWQADLGVDIDGPFQVFSAHPATSTAGIIWAGLLATVLNAGEAPTSSDLTVLLPKVRAYFDAMGRMEPSSGDDFESFLMQGMDARPIMVGFENAVIEFLTQHPRYADLIRDQIRVIYPEPTIFSSHPLIALHPRCERFSEALQDPDIQTIARTENGFRIGPAGHETKPAAAPFADLPENMGLAMPLPSADVMNAVVGAVR
ncbi:MAG: hypothetical protein AAF439_03105 [Pseudomonadota bacterium]